MKSLNWKSTGWSARNFMFFIGEEIFGKLSFNNNWNFNATYTDNESNLKFTQKGFWNRNVLITNDGKKVGEIFFRFFGNQILILESGERYILSTNAWGRNVRWLSQAGETLITFNQVSFSSMGKGVVSLVNPLPDETARLLIAGGLFIRQLINKRVAVVVVISIPIIAANQ